MKKQAIVCDLCDRMISTNLKYETEHCVICKRCICGNCSEPFMEDLFGNDHLICERCKDAFDDFDNNDYKILNEKYSKDLFEVVKKLIMTNEMRGNK